MTFLRRAFAGGAVAAAAAAPAQAQPQTFLDVTSLTSGFAGTFAGLLGDVTVNGSIASAGTGPVFGALFSAVSPAFFGSTTDGTSPQFGYAGIFTPTAVATDRVGYSYTGAGTARVTVVFGAPVTNLTFHVANLDGALFDFAPTAGATFTLLSGNGGGGDGLELFGTVLRDANAGTSVGVDPGVAAPTAGARSAYGSLRISGAVSTLVFDVRSNNTVGNGDSGSFTLSANVEVIPEPSTYALLAAGLGGVGLVARRRRVRLPDA